MEPVNPALRRLGALSVVIFALASIAVAGATYTALPFSPLRTPAVELVPLRLLLQQGWAFFTRNPQEERWTLFTHTASGGWEQMVHGPTAEPNNLFGADRFMRSQGVEFGVFAVRVPTTAWTECRGSDAECLDHATQTLHFENHAPRRTICGDLGVVMRKPVPWAWARTGKTIVMPAKAVHLKVKC